MLEALPDDMLYHIVSFLSVKDRLYGFALASNGAYALATASPQRCPLTFLSLFDLPKFASRYMCQLNDLLDKFDLNMAEDPLPHLAKGFDDAFNASPMLGQKVADLSMSHLSHIFYILSWFGFTKFKFLY